MQNETPTLQEALDANRRIRSMLNEMRLYPTLPFTQAEMETWDANWAIWDAHLAALIVEVKR